MEFDRLIERVCELGGLSAADAERAAEIVVETVGERLPGEEVHRLTDELPHPLGTWLARRRVPGSFTLIELYDRVHRRLGLPRSFAIEQTQVVCEALAELLDRHTLGRICAASPGPVAELFVVRLRTSMRPWARTPPEWDHILATGRPGSRRPLSEARPDNTHRESVARPNPHAETKLSSSRG